MRRTLNLEILSREDQLYLFDNMIAHIANCAGREEEVFQDRYKGGKRRDTSIDDLLEQDLEPCEWCQHTGRFLNAVPCPLCDATGMRPTARGIRKMRELVGGRLSRMRRSVLESKRHIEHLHHTTQEDWAEFIKTFPEGSAGAEFSQDFLEDQIAWAEGFVAETEEMIEKAEIALSAMDDLAKMLRIADRAIRVNVIEHERRVGVRSVPIPCADCGKTSAVMVDGVAYCKRHAHSRGLLTAPEPDPAQTPTPPPSVDDSGREGPQRLRMTRPFRFIDGPLAGQLHPVPRGETRVTVQGHVYERRGHHFEYAE